MKALGSYFREIHIKHIQWYAGKCLTAHFSGGKALVCGVP